MNILIPLSWLKDYIKTNASTEDIAKQLSLHAFNVERIESVRGDEIMEIEITPNRGDALSVLGIARELFAVLKSKGYKAEWTQKSYSPLLNPNPTDKLEVIIKDKTLVPRFSAVVIDNVNIKESPDYIKERLEKVGIRPLGNVIDVTNYMMIDKGQPMHAFDYDKIKGHKMIVRESRDGETVTTLDDVVRKLPQGVIVIEDGEGRLIDLCGIMGAKNSEVDENTKKVLLFVQVYDPVRIRRASMSLGHRTDAALRFEKGIDFEAVVPTLWESVHMLKDFAGATVSSDLIDIVNATYPEKTLKINYEKINEISGVFIDRNSINETLVSLGFRVDGESVVVPSWRYEDIEATEDLAEEVIRMYGYYNLPDKLLTGEIPLRGNNNSFYWEDFAKDFLRDMGFYEAYSYSATTQENAGQGALALENPFGNEFSYLRTSLIPQLLDAVEKNRGYKDKLMFFEMASVYLPRKNDLPDQPVMLGIATKGVDALNLKGIIEALFNQMGIKEFPDFEITPKGKETLVIEINFEELVKLASKSKIYTPICSYNSIKEDLTFEIAEDVEYKKIQKVILDSDERIEKLEFKDIYKNALTFSIEYLDRNKQISSEDTQQIRQKIFSNLEKKLKIRLKQ